jgi:TP901 family phage tail tape measure protein
MATKIGSLFGDVTLSTKALDKSIASVGRKLAKAGKSISAAGKQMSAKVTAPILAIGAAALFSFGQFQQGMDEVRSLMPDLNQGEFVQMQTEVRDLATEMGVNLVESTGALYQAISAGVPKDNVISFLAVSTRAAIAGVTDVETAVDGLTTVLNAYKMESSEAEHVSDILFTAVRLGKTNFEQLSASMFQVAPMAAAMNVPLEEVAAAVTTLTKQGVPTSVAMTQIRASLVGLQKPTATMSKALADMGFSSGQALIDAQGYLGALETLRTESGLTGQELAKAFKSVEGLGAVLSQTGSNFGGAIDDLQAMTEASGAMGTAFEVNNQGLFRDFARAKSIITEVAVAIGEQLAPYVTQAAEQFKAWYEVNKESIPGWVDLGIKIAGVAAVVGPLLLVVGQLMVILSSAATWWVGLGVAVAGVAIKFDLVREMGEAVGQLIADIFINGSITAAIGSFLGLLGEVIETFTGIQFSAEQVRSDVVKVFATIGKAIDSVVDKLGNMWELFGKVTGATAAGEALGDLISDVAFRASGGPVSAGSPYIVGEQGPELFVPKYSGGIVPNHAMGGGGGQTINMTFNGVGMEMRAWLKNNQGTIGQIAINAVSENNLRTV